MSSRHTRRKASKAKQETKLLALAQASRSADIAAIVNRNKSLPIERTTGLTSTLANVKGNVTAWREPRSGGGMSSQSVNSLKARKNVSFQGADMLEADSASALGQALSGKALREANWKAEIAKVNALRGK